jgi:hypothetical protein
MRKKQGGPSTTVLRSSDTAHSISVVLEPLLPGKLLAIVCHELPGRFLSGCSIRPLTPSDTVTGAVACPAVLAA